MKTSVHPSKVRDFFAYRTIDLITLTTLGIAFGVVFWGWDKLYPHINIAAVISYPPATGLLVGPWLIAGIVGGLVIRKPGAALACELIAASIELLAPGGNQWGISALASGFWQGLGAELIFALFLYKRFGVVVATLSAVVAAGFESVYEWHAYVPDWNFGYKLAYLGFMAVGGAIVAGIGGWFLTRALARTGALDSFGPGREAAHEV